MSYQPLSSIHICADTQRSFQRAFDEHMLAYEADKIENRAVDEIIEPIRKRRKIIEKEVASHMEKVQRQEARLGKAFTLYDEASAEADRQPRDIEVVLSLGRKARAIGAIQTALTNARSEGAKRQIALDRVNDDVRRITAEYEPARLARKANLDNLHKKAEEIKLELSTMQKVVSRLWCGWSANERVQHFENADFDFGIFGDRVHDKYMDELLQAYAETRPQYVPPRTGLIEVLISWVKDGPRRKPTDSFLWGEMVIQRR